MSTTTTNESKYTLEWEQMYNDIKKNAEQANFEPSPLFCATEEEMMLHNSTTKEAIQALLYDEDPNENAENFKDQGNNLLSKALKAKNMTKLPDVVAYYNQGLDCGITDLFLKSQILCNRAQVHLLMGNNGHAMEDGKECVKLLNKLLELNVPSDATVVVGEETKPDPNIVDDERKKKIHELKQKAFFRVAKGAAGVKKFKLAIQYCEKALSTKPSAQVRAEIEKLHQTAINGLQVKFQEKEELRNRSRQQKELPSKIKQLLDEHHIVVGEAEIDSTHFNQLIAQNQQEQATGHPSGIQISEESGVPVFHFRVILIYDEFNQTDIIQCFSENDTFEDHLTYMFPPQGPPFPYAPTDPSAAHRYMNGNLTVSFYDQNSIKTTKDVYYKVNMKDTLGKILRHPKYRLPSGLMPIFHVAPSNSSEAKSWKSL